MDFIVNLIFDAGGMPLNPASCITASRQQSTTTKKIVENCQQTPNVNNFPLVARIDTGRLHVLIEIQQ